MEVHHKHHLPKNWKEYLTEFFMLFAAVTLGFFAENYREHQIVNHRMDENYQALLQDLRQDSARIQDLRKNGVLERKGMHQLLNLIYRYQDNKLTWDQMKADLPGIEKLPSYITLFINNTTFKNMQSSGMLSYVSNPNLRKEMAYYYEVLSKKLIDNNSLYDDDGRKFYNEHFPLTQPAANRKIDSALGASDALERVYADPELNKIFVLNMPISKKIMTDPETLFRVESYYLRFCVYTSLLEIMEEQNKKLISIVEKNQPE